MTKHCTHCLCPLTLLDGERRRTCGQCREGNERAKKARQNRAYRERNRERLTEKSRDYYLARREAAIEYQRRYNAAKRERHHAQEQVC